MKTKGAKFNWFGLLVSVVFAELAGVVGALFTNEAVKVWYPTLAKPAINPPSWLFAPVWTTLFLLMGVAAYLVFINHNKQNNNIWTWAITFYVVQLVLNTYWSILFFGYQQIGPALAEIIILWVFILTTMLLFYRIKPLAGWLLAPYLAWVSFATYLNYNYWLLN